MIKGLSLGGGLPHLRETIKIKTHHSWGHVASSVACLSWWLFSLQLLGYNHTNPCLISIISIFHLVARLWRSETLYALLWAACCAAGILLKHSKKMNPIDLKTVDMRLLYSPLSGQAVMAAAQQLQWKSNSGCAIGAALSPAAEVSSFLPLFYPLLLAQLWGWCVSRQLSSWAAGGECCGQFTCFVS